VTARTNSFRAQSRGPSVPPIEEKGDVGSIGKPPLSKSGFPGSNPGVPANKKTPPERVLVGPTPVF
jgi:hypothetical protein